MPKKKKIKKIHRYKIIYGIALIVLLLAVIFIVKVLYSVYKINTANQNANHVHYTFDTLLDAACHLRMDEEYKNDKKLREKLNEEIDMEFISKCGNSTSIGFSICDSCNYDDFSHYVDVKVLLNQIDKESKNKLVATLENSYSSNKDRYIKDYLSVFSNKWPHVLLAMERLGMLNESEKKFWIRQYSSMNLNQSQFPFPQTWNRVWVFWTFGIENYKDLEQYGVKNASKVCSYIPRLRDALSQNIFRESSRTMINKYVIISIFCSKKLTEAEKESLIPYSKNIISCGFDNEKMKKLYQNLLKN